MAKITLYNQEYCAECRAVREKLAELELSYMCVNVPKEKSKRQDVYTLTGECMVPVLVDEDKVLKASDNILEYLIERYGHNTIRPLKY